MLEETSQLFCFHLSTCQSVGSKKKGTATLLYHEYKLAFGNLGNPSIAQQRIVSPL